MANGGDSIKQEHPTVPPRPPPTATPPPRETDLADDKAQSLLNSLRSTSFTPQEYETCMRSLTSVMTSSEDEDEALFQEVISKLNETEFWRMVGLLTLKPDDRYFLEIARNKNGSIRLHKLLGKSDNADALICVAILRHFFHAMTDKNVSYVVAIQGMRVFRHDKKRAMRDQLLHHAVSLARTRHGSIMLRAIITDDDFEYCRHCLLGKLAYNALLLSYDAYGTSVVQHALEHGALRSTRNISVRLRGHYAELSFTEGGRHIVEKLLERDEETEALVVEELLKCQGDELVKLATSVYGHFVVEKALKVTRVDLFKGLVNKLKPFLPLLRTSPQSTTIAEILESVR
ncbi:putative pumilio homolog 20 [Raphanus sativus]|uniref:Pumilio homolog 20 n=1 Tax=Raphanus sativus TaxID=3726 RepID=A0A6J0L049_RAPSA|nr:putative pumilio homolog 20 [Raphanus sativus]